MTESPDRFPWETDDDDAFMGPAVPTDERSQADDAMPEPLAPFVGGADAEGPDEMPWLIPDDAEVLGIEEIRSDEPLQPEAGAPAAASESGVPSAAGAEPETDAGSAPAIGGVVPDGWSPFDDLPGTEALTSEPEPVQTTGAERDRSAAPADEDHGGPPPAAAQAFAAWPEREEPQGVGAVPGTEALEPPATGPGLSDSAEAVAARLERIARKLRDGDISGLLGPAADPLESFVAGYVLGSIRPGRS